MREASFDHFARTSWLPHNRCTFQQNWKFLVTRHSVCQTESFSSFSLCCDMVTPDVIQAHGLQILVANRICYSGRYFEVEATLLICLWYSHEPVFTYRSSHYPSKASAVRGYQLRYPNISQRKQESHFVGSSTNCHCYSGPQKSRGKLEQTTSTIQSAVVEQRWFHTAKKRVSREQQLLRMHEAQYQRLQARTISKA